MDLSQAVNMVIDQNKSLGFTPTRFIEMTGHGDHPDLDTIITNLVKKDDLLEFLEQQIEKFGEVLSIEDLITFAPDGFGLSEEIIKKAREKSNWFNIKRGTDNDWIKRFFQKN